MANEFRLKSDVEIEYDYEDGSIFDLIHKKAADIGANLIILGTHGKKGFQHIFGSFALKVLTQARVPTLVVQQKKFTGFKNILFPVNTFTEARQKVVIAANVARKFSSTIHIFKEIVKDVNDMNRIEIITRQIIEAFKKEGIKYTIKEAEKSGDTSKQLISYSAASNIDLIMILTEPQIGTNYFNLGPWNEKIMFNEAQVPVMCINPVEHSQVFFGL